MGLTLRCASFLMFALMLGCGGANEADAPSSAEESGGEDTSGGLAEAESEQPVGMVGVLREPDPVLPVHDARQAHARAEAQAAARARFEAECGGVEEAPGMPPAVTLPTGEALASIVAHHEAVVEHTYAMPADTRLAAINAWFRGTYATWLREMMARIRLFEAAASDLTPEQLAQARPMAVRNYAIFAERVGATPVPDEVAANAETRRIYWESLADQHRVLVAQGRNFAGTEAGAELDGLRAWLLQEECAVSAKAFE
ncbi:MAG: hypothetical protein AAF411_05900 [Myxococcota bacterium]